MFYKIRLLNNSLDQSTAEIVPYDSGDGSYTLMVYSDNPKMKSHLETVLARDAYLLSPGRASANFYPDGVLHVYPGTVEYLQALPEILAWAGYFAEFSTEVHKSVHLVDYDYIALKSTDNNIYTNANGERIVKRVPEGYMAVHTDGRVVASGRWLNANIDKEDAEWQLVPNPYEQMTPEQRAAEREYIELLISEYHPGAYEELYEKRKNENDDYYYAEEEFSPEEGKRLSQIYPMQQPIPVPTSEKTATPPHLPVKIPEGKILYSPTSGIALPSKLWPPTGVEGYESMRWYFFDDNSLSDEAKEKYIKLFGGIRHPALAPGVRDGIVQLDKNLPVEDGFKLSIPGTSSLDISINIPAMEKFTLDMMNEPEYIEKSKAAKERLDAINSLVRNRDPENPEKLSLDPRLSEMEIEDLRGPEANFMMNLYDHQKAGVAYLTETSQYEAFGGPKGWHGAMLSTYYGSGKVQPNDEIVYTPKGPTTMGELNPGDLVVSEKGTPVQILDVFPHKNWQFYTVTFDDGSTTEVGLEHLWYTLTSEEVNSSEGAVRATEDIWKTIRAGHYVPVTMPVQFSSNTIAPVAPYSLGRALMEHSRQDETVKKTLGLDCSYIPDVYHTLSVVERRNLFQGIVDGAYKTNRLLRELVKKVAKPKYVGGDVETYVLTFRNKRLAEDVRYLALGLGMWAKLSRLGLRQWVLTVYAPPQSLRDNVTPVSVYRKIVSIEKSRKSDGACILVDSPEHLYLTRDFIVTHNTAMILAADAVMRNRGLFKNGEQATIISAPNKNVHVWYNEVVKFRNEGAYIIEGSRQERVEQWEELLQRAREGTLPKIIIVGSSQFRMVKPDKPETPEEAQEREMELGMDAQYMKLLALGGTSQGKAVRGGHVAALAMDESGQFVNFDAARHKALSEITDSVYASKGLVWTMNGDLLGNSCSDTISEISFVDKYVRDNYLDIVYQYTAEDQKVRSKMLGRRVWRVDGKNGVRQFLNQFANHHIFSLTGDVVVGDDWGLVETPDVSADLGANWGKLYKDCFSKLSAASEHKLLQKALGLLQIMIGASHGAVHPSRMMEYNIGMNKLVEGMKKALYNPNDPLSIKKYEKWLENVRIYQGSVTEHNSVLGLIPREGVGIPERNSLFNARFSDDEKELMMHVLSSWDNPVADVYEQEVANTIANSEAGKYVKIGIANTNKVFLQVMARRLRERYGDKVLVQVVDGDTPADQVADIQKRHQAETGRHVVTLVSGAGKYGLSLPAERTIRCPGWNPATSKQMGGRFHRSAEQFNLATVVVPSGLFSYMRNVEDQKFQRQLVTRGAVLEIIDDETEEGRIQSLNKPFLAELSKYMPKIREKESSDV